MIFLSKKDYIGSIEILPEYNILYGTVISYKGKCIEITIVYHGETPKEFL